MPQEAGTSNLIERRGAGILLKRSNEIVPTIRHLLDNPGEYSRMKAATAGLTMPNSTEQIIKEINALLPQQFRTAKAAA